MNTPGPDFEARAPLHVWQEVDTFGQEVPVPHRGFEWLFRCTLCGRFVAGKGRFRKVGHCGVPQLGGYWTVGGRIGVVGRIDRREGTFTLFHTADATRTKHPIGTPDEAATPPWTAAEELWYGYRDPWAEGAPGALERVLALRRDHGWMVPLDGADVFIADGTSPSCADALLEQLRAAGLLP